MLDRKYIVENADAVKTNCANRNIKVDVDRLTEVETARRAKAQEVQDLNTAANDYSKRIGKAKDDAEREELKNKARDLRGQKEVAQTEHDKLESEAKEVQLHVPNMAHPDCPVGVDDKANLELGFGKHSPREFDFKPT